MDTTELAIVVTLAGIVIVFTMLVLLIFIIKGYGAIVGAVTKSFEKKKAAKDAAEKALNEEETSVLIEAEITPATANNGELPGELVAVIAAAVDSIYGEGNCKIKSIKKIPQSRPVWSTAGLMENTRPF